MKFGEALERISQLACVRREGWPKGQGMFLVLTAESVKAPRWALEGANVTMPPAVFVAVPHEGGKKLVPFTPSQEDMLAGDWAEFES